MIIMCTLFNYVIPTTLAIQRRAASTLQLLAVSRVGTHTRALSLRLLALRRTKLTRTWRYEHVSLAAAAPVRKEMPNRHQICTGFLRK